MADWQKEGKFDYLNSGSSYLDQLGNQGLNAELQVPSQYSSVMEWQFYAPDDYALAIDNAKKQIEDSETRGKEHFLTGDMYIPVATELTDMAGAALWGSLEAATMGAGTVADIAAEGGVGRKFGYEGWGQEDWASNLGYFAGSLGTGLKTLALTGQGLKGLAAVGGVGKRTMMREGAKVLSQQTDDVLSQVSKIGPMSNDMSSNVFKIADDAITKGQSRALKEAEGYAARGRIKTNPFGDMDLQSDIVRRTKEGLKTKLDDVIKNGDDGADWAAKVVGSDEAMNAVVKEALTSAQSYGSMSAGQFNRALAVKLGNGKVASYVGDAAYEGLLLGVHAAAHTLVGNYSADALDLSDEQYERRSWMKDALIGTVTGTLFPAARRIAGGKDVQIGMNGMMPSFHTGALKDTQTFFKALYGKLGRSPKITWDTAAKTFGKDSQLTPKQVQTMLRNVYDGSGKSDLVFKNVGKNFNLTFLTDPKALDNTSSLKALYEAYHQVTKDALKIALPMAKEIGKDLWYSMPRMLVGTAVMNAHGFHENWDHYPADRMAIDIATGMLFLKRKHIKPGSDPTKYYGSGEFTGNELAQYAKTLDILGYDKKTLDYYGGVYSQLDVDDQLAFTLVEKANSSSKERRDLSALIQADKIDAVAIQGETVKRTAAGEDVRTFVEHGALEFSAKIATAKELRDKGDEVGAKLLEQEARVGLAKWDIAKRLVDSMNLGLGKQDIRPMSREESLDFIEKLNTLQWKGKDLSHENVDQFLSESRIAGVNAVTSDVQNLVENYIRNSLDALGMWNDSMVQKTGKINVHESIMNVLDQVNKQPNHAKTAEVFKAVLTLANQLNIIKLGSEGIRWESSRREHSLSNEKLDLLLNQYNTSTDLLHESVFGDGKSNWRDIVPGKKEGEFLDVNILAATPIWHALQTNMLHMRNAVGYDLITGKNLTGMKDSRLGELHDKVDKEFFKGKGKAAIKEVPSSSDIPNAEDVVNFIRNLNEIRGLTGREGGTSEVTFEMAQKIYQEFKGEVGNLFSNPEHFLRFKDFAYEQYLTDIIGDTNVGRSLRRAVSLLLDKDNPLALRNENNGTTTLPSKIALEKVLLGALSEGSPKTFEQVKEIRELIEAYRTNIENVLKDKGNIIKFSDDIVLSEASVYTREDWQQHLSRIVTQIEGDKLFRLEHVMKTVDQISKLVKSDIWNQKAHWESMVDVATGKKEINDLKADFEQLKQNTLNLVTLISNGAQYQDVTLLRSLIDRQFDVQRSLAEVNSFTSEGRAFGKRTTLGDLATDLKSITQDIIRTRNEKLGLDSFGTIENFIQKQSELNRYTDGGGRRVSERQTISENVYTTRYETNDVFMDLLRGNIKSSYDNYDTVEASVKTMLDSPALKNLPGHIKDDILNNLSKAGLNESLYISQIIEPQLKAHWDRIKNTQKAKDSNLTFSDFITDTFQLLQSAGGQKTIQLATYKGGGQMDINNATISNWNKGFNSIIDVFGFDSSPGSFLLVSKISANKGRVSNNLDINTINSIRNDIANGVHPKFKISELITAREQEELQKLIEGQIPIGGGQGGRSQFGLFSLDSKTMVMVSYNKYQDIVSALRNPQSRAYTKFVDVLGENSAANFIENVLRVQELNLRDPNAAMNSGVIENVLNATRLAFDRPDVLRDWASGKVDPNQLPKVFKYFSLSSPRNGIALNERVINLADAYVKQMFKNDVELEHLAGLWQSQAFVGDKISKQRQFIIFDEKDPSGKTGFFDAHTRHKDNIELQLIRDFGLDPEQAKQHASNIAEKTKSESKTTVDAEVYLSLPEMAQMLIAKGAKKDWFVWENGEVVGFNVSIKPTVSHSEVTSKGAMTVVLDKTAYKFDPTMDASMKNRDGTYWTDTIAMKSATKVGKKSAGWNMPTVDIGVGINLKSPLEKELGGQFSDWKDVLSRGLRTASHDRLSPGMVEIDRSNILLKSISGPHKGTISVAFGNFLSNDAQMVLDNWLGSTRTIHDLTRRIGSIQENPYTLLGIAKELMISERALGDLGSKMSGLEYIINGNGLPTYEFMRPQIERSLTSHYMNSHNFVSGEINYGGYNVMTAGSGLTDPIRHNGIQFSFGGSGVPWYVGNQKIRQLLNTPGVEGIPIVMKMSEVKARELNKLLGERFKKEGLEFDSESQDLISRGEEYLAMHSTSGTEFTGPVYGKLNRWLLDGAREGNREITQIERNKINRITKEVLQDVMTKDYDLVLKSARENLPDEATYSSLVEYLDTGKFGFDNTAEIRVNKDTPGFAAELAGYDGIFTGAVDLRTPKDGINSWVISKVQKILDKRRGAVSEINQADAINPQDADFDLDKSSQFIAAPSKVLGELYGGSGYHERSSHQILEAAGMELSLGNPRKYEQYLDELNTLDKQRAPIVRQHSVAAFLMQYFSSISENRAFNILKPGYRTGVEFSDGVSRVSNNIHDINTITEFKGSNDKSYKVTFREAGEFVDSVQFMKSIIKEMIDVYSDPKSLNNRNVQDFFWFHEKVGLFKISEYNRKNGRYEEVNWLDPNQDVSKVRTALGKNIVRPLNDLFNLANGTETLSDGTSRKLTIYDYVKTFDNVKWRISQLKQHQEWIDGNLQTVIPVKDVRNRAMLDSFADNILKFLGDGWSSQNGQSQHNLVKGLNELSKSIDNQFKGRRINRDDLLANILESNIHPTDDMISKAIKSYVKDESSWVSLSSVRWEINRISDLMNDMKIRRQDKTSEYSRFQYKIEKLSKVMQEAEKEFNNTFIGRAVPKFRNGTMAARSFTRVYTLDSNKEVSKKRDYEPGEFVKWYKGEVVIENPRRFVMTDNLDQNHRRSMYRAFGSRVRGVSEFDAFRENGLIKQLEKELFDKIRELDNQHSDQIIKDSRFYSDVSDMELSTLRDVFTKAYLRSSGHGEQLLWNLLTPRVSNNVASIMNYDTHANAYFTSPFFRSNKRSEKMVISFLSRALEGKVPELSKDNAREMLNTIEKRRNTSLVREWDKTLDGEAFRSLDTNFSRTIEGLQIIPTQESSPHWTKAEVKNESARLVMQSYMTGSYRLDPIELYRLTAGLDKSLNSTIDANTIGERIGSYWTDISDIDLGKGSFRYSRRSMREKIDTNREYTKHKKASEMIEESGCGL